MVYGFVVLTYKPVQRSSNTVLYALNLVKGSCSYRFRGRIKRRSIRCIFDPSLRNDLAINSSVANTNN